MMSSAGVATEWSEAVNVEIFTRTPPTSTPSVDVDRITQWMPILARFQCGFNSVVKVNREGTREIDYSKVARVRDVAVVPSPWNHGSLCSGSRECPKFHEVKRATNADRGSRARSGGIR